MGIKRRSTTLLNIFFILFVLFVSVKSQVEQRNRGNVQRNTLEILSKDDAEVTIMATRGEGPGEGRRVKSTFSSRGFPNFRVSRWSSVGEADEQVGVSIRLSLLSIVEYQENPSGRWGIDATDTVFSTLSLVNMTFDPIIMFEDAQDDIGYKYFILDSTEKSTVSLPNIFDNFEAMDPELGALPLIRIGAGLSDLRGFVGRLNRTLSPATWQFGIEVFGFPYQRNDTFLAVKFAVESQEDPYFRHDLPYTERDDPFITMNDIQSNSPDYVSGMARDDIAYFSWEVTAVTTGGSPSNQTRNWIQSGILASEIALGNTNLIAFEQDMITAKETILDSIDYGRNTNETSRSFLYFSLPVRNATSVNWDPYVGIDEKDDAFFKSSSVAVVVNYVLILCIIVFMSV